tara:strand:+ start:543 stop:806 length:264 start_codon:yes stop_codon:yes gene_type:complete
VELKKIKVKNDDCCIWAKFGYSLSQQLKLDDTFKDVEIEHVIVRGLQSIRIYLNGIVWYDAKSILRAGKPHTMPAEHVKNIKEQYKL